MNTLDQRIDSLDRAFDCFVMDLKYSKTRAMFTIQQYTKKLLEIFISTGISIDKITECKNGLRE